MENNVFKVVLLQALPASGKSEGEIVVQYVRRMKALEQQLLDDLQSADRRLTRLRVGITHTAESNLITEVLAKFGQ